MPISQANRTIAIATPLGDDVLVLQSMTGGEQLGAMFRYELELLSEDEKIDPNGLLGENVTVRLLMNNGETRYFNGYISRFTLVGGSSGLARYQATMVPWTWFLTRHADCRMFQEMTVPDIIKQVFRDRGFSDFDDALTNTYRTWEYCVQYRETDFNFVSRLMEQEGMYYFFAHENGKHKLVLSDSASAHEAFAGYETIKYYPPGGSARREEEYVSDWAVDYQVQPTKYELNDFDFKDPTKALLKEGKIQRDHAAADGGMYDYPGEYTEPADGEGYAKTRVEEWQAGFEVARAIANARGIATGCTFTLSLHPRDEQNREYLITGANYQLESDEFGSSSGGGSTTYSCSFRAIDLKQPFRSPRVTPKPVVQGPQTAIVAGKSGEELWTDKYGRVKVKFHWDLDSKGDENSSCWIRVAQVWAGKKWGSVFTPRIGQEVIVEFLEGDPDRPLITGRVYNNDNMPPYELPKNATMSAIKSNTSKGGGGFNEFRFEDKKGEEQIFIHAQKNMDIRVVNDRFEIIGTDGEGSRHLIVEKDKLEKIKNDKSEEVVRDKIVKIGRDHNVTIAGKEAIKITGSHSETIEDDVIEVYKKNQSTEITEDLYVKAANICIEATDNITIKVGDSFIAIESGGIKLGTTGDIIHEADGDITETAQGNVTMEATGNVEGTATGDVKFEATGNAEYTGTASAKLEASGTTTVKGASVSVN